jgi:hypothetical protein
MEAVCVRLRCGKDHYDTFGSNNKKPTAPQRKSDVRVWILVCADVMPVEVTMKRPQNR